MKTVIFILILITIISTAGCTLQTIETAKIEPEATISNERTNEETKQFDGFLRLRRRQLQQRRR